MTSVTALWMYESAAWLCGAVLVYSVLARRIADWMQPYRLRLAELGEEILADRSLAHIHGEVRFVLDTAYSGWVVALMSVAVPVKFASMLAKSVWHRVARKHRGSGQEQRMPREFVNLAILSHCAANPLFGIVVILETAVIATVTMLFVGGPAAAVYALRSLWHHPSLMRRIAGGHA